LFALWPLHLAVRQLLAFIDIGMSDSSFRLYGADDNSNGYLIYAIGYGLFAVFLLRAAPLVMTFAYPDPVTDSVDDSGSAEESSVSAD
jgi:hypothetical protein